MKYGLFFVSLLVFVVIVLAGDTAYCLELRSDAFEDGGDMPVQYTGKGKDVSPALTWSDVPARTQSFALIMDDPDAPMGTWVHWVIFNIPETATGLKEDIPGDLVLDDGTRQGMNSFRWVGYGGPHPPRGPKHRYFFRLYALDIVLELRAGANKGQLIRAMQKHILDEATLMGKFGEQ